MAYETYYSNQMFIIKCTDEQYLVLVRGEAGVLKSPFVCGIDAKQLVSYLLLTRVLKPIDEPQFIVER